MIRINLLRERKVKRKADRGQRTMLNGFLALLLGAAGVYFLVHVPISNEIDQLNSDISKKKASITKLTEETKEFDAVQAQVNAAVAREAAIKRLNDARAVPAWMLFELGSMLTKDHKPTMNPDMAKQVQGDPNRKMDPSWDPKRMWIESLEVKDGKITIKGGAQASTDVTQFVQRLQASVFFTDVVPEVTTAANDTTTKVGYYTFTITGKVLY